MKNPIPFALLTAAGVLSARAALTDNLIAYYNFEAPGNAGIANMVPGNTTHAGRYGSGTTTGAIPAFGSGAGYAGSTTFAGAEAAATTDRSDLLAGTALNVAKSDASTTAGSGWFNVPTLSATALGPNFTISAWFFLAPDADNTGSTADVLRDYVFEGGTNFDVSFGTNAAAGSVYASWIGEAASSPSATLSTGQWHHVAHVFTQNGANTNLTVYIDGAQVGAVLSAATTTMNFASINFGAARNGVRVFDGMLNEVGVWNRSLTPQEVTELNALGTAGTPILTSVAVALSSSPVNAGTINGSGTYHTGVPVPVSAIANPGYIFSGWTGDFTGQAASFTYTASAAANATATFTQDLADSDGDGLSNYDEAVVHHTLPGNPDTDGDLIPDGDEILITGTSPTASDGALVNFVRNNLDPDRAGAIALAPLRIGRDASTGVISLSLSLSGSADQNLWQDIDLGSPSASIVPSGDGWNITFPAPSSTLNSYVVRTHQP
ncbi:LamG domain-containing protein [Luteolibacter sp. Populi]|uniref:LamG domain-containing protein n=1 Tax=Luteolibacter sp. Populi TaxID=3230487 RepID=UPI0034670746